MIRRAMPTDLTVVLRDQPGELARVAESLVAAGVHLRGLAAFTGDEHGFAHALIEDQDLDTARQTLKRERIKIADTREMLLVDSGPGGLVDVLLRLSDAKVNVDLAYTACHDKVAIATDDVYNARDALSS
jgi:hypothetical protein